MELRSIFQYLICLSAILTSGCDSHSSDQEKQILRVFHAGSLAVPFQKIEALFESQNPGVDVRREAYGSVQAIRQVTELGKRADVVASADYRLIDSMMIGSEKQWARWNLMFARNAMCLALSPDLKNATDWSSVLSNAANRVGISNPNLDPCGYRSLMSLYLAQSNLGRVGLYDSIIRDGSNIEAEVTSSGAILRVPSALRQVAEGRLTIRPKETDLIPLVQSGAIDCLMIYRSVAVQHGMPFVELPPEISLSRAELDNSYGTVSVVLRSDRPADSKTVRGGAIVYGVTVPENASDKVLARAFVDLLQSKAGRKILNDCGQKPLKPGTESSASLGF